MSATRWTETVSHFNASHVPFPNVLVLVEFLHLLPVTNVVIAKCHFPFMNTTWTNDKTELGVDALKAMLMTRVNYTEFLKMLLEAVCGRGAPP